MYRNLPPVVAPQTLYLENPGTGNTTSDPTLSFTTTAPTTATLANYDTDRDAAPGRSLARTGAGLSETDPTKYQRWSGVPGPSSLNGPVDLQVWAAVKQFDNKLGRFTAALQVCSTNLSSCRTLAQANAVVDQSQGPGGFIPVDLSFGQQNETITASEVLSVKIVVDNNSDDDLWLAYDTLSHPSRLSITAATDHSFTVTATNQMGTSTPSNPSLLISPALGSSPADPPPPPPVVVAPYEPDPIVKIDLSGPHPAVIDIPGYVSVPMGLVSIQNPGGLGDGAGSTVAISGGILAAGFRVADGRDDVGSGELTVPIGLINPVVQRTYKIISETTSGLPKVVSTAVVQVNQNGAYAVNSWEVQ
jgi:hypothetical protein